ncbi:DEAD/DEAH box helicase [Calothrix sp. PCC 6303]|uniref:DEAD/DEAH box helicase n=1 Tax=Calothrix sp. PCC 6303 TaxID=1170562 RepID=UPI0002A02794|nr:DEAD/DEAH box helicase [Calothrix sp. PCC 6303]AFZ00227.1 SNF2-related protein [Calothrix sp. PCC 6303]
MMTFEVVNQKLQAQLADKYRQQSQLEQKIIQLCSIIYEPFTVISLVSCLERAEIYDGKNRIFTSQSLLSYTNRLIENGLIVKESKQHYYRCHSLLMEIATRDAVKSGNFAEYAKAVDLGQPVRTFAHNGARNFQNDQQFIREVRIALYSHDADAVNKHVEDYEKFSYRGNQLSLEEILLDVCNNPFDGEWISSLPDNLYDNCMWMILRYSSHHLVPADEAFATLQENFLDASGNHSSELLGLMLTEQLLLRGCVDEAQEILESLPGNTYHTSPYWGWLCFLQGENARATTYFTQGLAELRKAAGKRTVYFSTTGGVFYILALIKEGSPKSLQEALEHTTRLARQSDHWLRMVYYYLKVLLQVHTGDVTQKRFIQEGNILFPGETHSLEVLLYVLCYYWVDMDGAEILSDLLEVYYKNAVSSGYHWLGMEAAELLARMKSESSYDTQAEILREDIGITSSIVDVIKPVEEWEQCLTALANLNKEPTKIQIQSENRMAWFLTLGSNNSYTLQAKEQKINKKGEWSKGRPIALKRLREAGEFDYLTPQDLRICSCVEVSYDTYYYGKGDYRFNSKVICALIGHPLVFLEDTKGTRVEIVKGEPELIVKKTKQGKLTLEFSPKLKEEDKILTIKQTPTRIKVIEVTSEHRRIAEILGKKNKLQIPAIAEKQVLAAINAVSGIVTVHSDIGGEMAGAEEVPAQSIPHVHLLPLADGLKITFLSCPFGSGGSYFRPGSGGETVIAEIAGKRLQTKRNLREEKQLTQNAIASCPTLSKIEEENGEWQIPEPEDCLELLLQLQALGDTVIIEHPEGEKFRVSHQADLKNFSLNIQRQQDWFAASGELKLDDSLVLDMQNLMELLERTPSRFIPLGDGKFVALTEAFRKRLDELRMYSESNGKGMRFHPLATFGLEDFVDEVGKFKADKHWKEHIKRLKEARDYQPEIPSTFQAELREYQTEGFNWMARLSHWGVGACLADQMGLGKTVQALGVILTRAQNGATLIIAPTSVCSNWVSEAEKFAPTLNIIQFGSGNRQKTLDELQPFDMVVCSYGLLQQEEVAQMLAQIEWQTIVLDEAQAIKNMTTKRSQAAMNLKAGFKLITTGTPIENHLGELWNLFRFINPGLLGSFDSFNQKFAVPIEKYQDKAARTKLKKLVQPFLLRRIKNEVLQELPSRTEILLHVELSKEETAFYEALRREAIAKLSDSDSTAGQKHLQVLAEIMRLRRACCNSRLVMAESDLPSSKLQLFGEVLGDLLENRHKALVFSQFVDHLHIIKNYLEDQNIKYQYLDGSTPAAERKKRVDAFQGGEGDVFLISLKAGGTGLNLTAADYVIHMDPWWNPAVEDQASDRAHRIGQQRPVTIYRLVAKNTIEDKIVDLHKHKRDLADSLLEGADISGKMSTDVLLKLMGV